MKNKFIVFEGIDGCGKTTQIKRFVEFLFDADKHNHVTLTREPFQDVNTRKILMHDSDPRTNSEELAKLFIADRKKHVQKLIKPNLAMGNFVVCDRYKFSTIAYQSAQGIPMEKLIKLQEKIMHPDMVFIVDLPAKIAQSRMRSEAGRKEHKFEASIDFLEATRQNYLALAKKFPNMFVINGNQTRDKVTADIINCYIK